MATPRLENKDVPIWRVGWHLPTDYVLASSSKTEATILWESTLCFDNLDRTPQEIHSIVICDCNGNPLSPVYKQKHTIFQAAIPVHVGDIVIKYFARKSFSPAHLNIYCIESVQDHVCMHGNRPRPTVWEANLLDVPYCPECGSALIFRTDGALMHPKGVGWIIKTSIMRPMVTFSTLVDDDFNPGNTTYPPFDAAIEAARKKAEFILAEERKLAPAYVRLD